MSMTEKLKLDIPEDDWTPAGYGDTEKEQREELHASFMLCGILFHLWAFEVTFDEVDGVQIGSEKFEAVASELTEGAALATIEVKGRQYVVFGHPEED